jgi:hypothetical protein
MSSFERELEIEDLFDQFAFLKCPVDLVADVRLAYRGNRQSSIFADGAAHRFNALLAAKIQSVGDSQKGA